MKDIIKLEPEKFVFDHQLVKHLSKPLQVLIIQDFNKSLDPSWPVWKTQDWFYFLEQYIEDYITLDDKVKEELEDLRKYLVHNAEFDYIIVGD